MQCLAWLLHMQTFTTNMLTVLCHLHKRQADWLFWSISHDYEKAHSYCSQWLISSIITSLPPHSIRRVVIIIIIIIGNDWWHKIPSALWLLFKTKNRLSDYTISTNLDSTAVCVFIVLFLVTFLRLSFCFLKFRPFHQTKIKPLRSSPTLEHFSPNQSIYRTVHIITVYKNLSKQYYIQTKTAFSGGNEFIPSHLAAFLLAFSLWNVDME